MMHIHDRDPMLNPVLDVADLRVHFGHVPVVQGVDLTLYPGECVAIVGESGSGKSVTARALLGLAGTDAIVSTTKLMIAGHERRAASAQQWRGIRGKHIGLVLQDALVSLDPLRPIGREIKDSIRLHDRVSDTEAQRRVSTLLEQVGMPDPQHAMRQRSGELSGGLRQRALIAAALAMNPPVLIADEPTTALDVSIQARILALLSDIKSRGTAIVLISHDLAVVSNIADRVIVMRDGLVVESGPMNDVLYNPRAEYTKQLIAAVPGAAALDRGALRANSPTPTPAAAAPNSPALAPLLGTHDLSKSFRSSGTRVAAVDSVSLDIYPGETLGLVGESGSGKTTLGRLILGLETPDAGTITLDGEPWSPLRESARRARRHRMSAIYQDSLSSFDPRWTVARTIQDANRGEESLEELLEQVGLSHELASRHPATLSGGQRQRVSIARALASQPDLLVCDEPVSALDVTIQAQILELLARIQSERSLSMLFISHDLGVIQQLSDRVAVMRHGAIVELNNASDLFENPQHEYTAQLVSDAPRLHRGHVG